MLEEAGLIEQQGGPARADAEGPPRDRLERARTTCSPSWPRTSSASTRSSRPGSATSAPTTPSRTSSATRSTSTSQRTIRNAIRRTGRRHAGAARRPTTSRSSGPSTSTRSSHRADARPVAVDADARQLPAGQEGGDGAALADLDRSSRATTSGIVGFSEVARVLTRRAAARGVVGLRVRHQHAARVHAGPPAARPRRRAPSRSS